MEETISGSGIATRFTSIKDAQAALDSAASTGSNTLVVGALPFDPEGQPVLFTPQSHKRHSGQPDWNASGDDHSTHEVLKISQNPSPEQHAQRIEAAISAIRSATSGSEDPALAKVVLSREEIYTLAEQPHPQQLLRKFIESSATGHGHLVQLDLEHHDQLGAQPDTTHGPHFFIGSSPELLIRKQGASIVSHPLAGTIARSQDPVTDQARAIELTLSHKDIAEHRFVTQAIRDILEPLCEELHVPEHPSLEETSHTWHLGTRIEGTLKDPSISVLELAALLHPTPAVNGSPYSEALAYLREHEPDRGFYAGTVGYANSAGDGEWRVSIRSAELRGRTVRACAGGGIVADSDPQQEVEETTLKFGPVRALLGLDQPDQQPEAPAELSPLHDAHGPDVLANHMPRELAQQYHQRGLWTEHTHWDIFQHTVARHGDQSAATDKHRSLTWQQLADSVDWATRHLHRCGVRRGDGCILQLPNSVVFLESLLAVWKLGAIPIFALPAHGSTDVRHFATQAPARFYISTSRPDRHLSSVHEALREPLDDARVVTQILVDEAAESPWFSGQEKGNVGAVDNDNPRAADVDANELAFLQLSGGTTGVPKLIPRTHADYLYSIRCAMDVCDLQEGDCLLAALPAPHNFTLSSPGILGAMMRGVHVVFAPSAMPSDVLPAIERHGATHMALVPPAMLGILNHPALHTHDLRTLKTVWVGGAKLSEEAARRIEPELGCRLQQVFGMAEGLVNFTPLGGPSQEVVGTQGRPMSPFDEIRIINDADIESPHSHSGYLLTRGPYTIRGYHRAPEINARSFTKDGFYITGDIVNYTDGALTVVGRAKDQINRGGEKIAPEAGENALLSHPDIHDVSVVGTPDEQLGEVITAYVIPRDGVSDLSPLKVRKHARAAGVAKFAVPDRVHIVSSFPTTGVGKINKGMQQADSVLINRKGEANAGSDRAGIENCRGSVDGR